jgi:4-hydroxythreonine-4-phosphate dehydrogenase
MDSRAAVLAGCVTPEGTALNPDVHATRALPLAITMGDPCGIGPEIVARLFLDPTSSGCVVLGDVGVMRRAARLVDPMLPVVCLDTPADLAGAPPRCIPVIQVAHLDEGLATLPWGQVSASAGAAAARCIEAAVAMALEAKVSGIVTAPIHKKALAAGGSAFAGHTEMLQALAATVGHMPAPVRMMLANDELRTVLVTIHQSVRQAIDAIDVDSVLQTLRIAHRAAAAWGQSNPRIAVAGLNPHAGEGGLFGDEEIRLIAPAIAQARTEGIDATGPFAPDTVFMRARNAAGHPGEFDIVVAMLHDHGLIPVKYLGVEHGVNVTLGLPFIRTSPDHGTAFDIAGSGLASPASLAAAVEMARRLRDGTLAV